RVHHFDGRGDDPGADDRRYRSASGVDAVERRKERLHALWFAQNSDDYLRRDPERAFGTNQETNQVGTGRIDHRTADVHQFSIGQDEVERQDVVHGEPVFQAVRTAGILGDVSADRAYLLTRRIWCVVVPVRRNGSRDIEVRDARFDGDPAV